MPWLYLTGGGKKVLGEDESKRWRSVAEHVSGDWPGGGAGELKRSVVLWLRQEKKERRIR